ncbi:5'-methylthioadenosine/S-adenosylhomocysteine nucleosidase [Aspergillus lucknowensis]|uniref:Nucleoside phosphorylase domain-containing protein n=1 Tax=Aspergillus lucknowensis TaxID=176173 RepID=A0ABR4LZD4_9EURO
MANEPIVKTDGDLACDELLNSYLDRSDFVSTFSLDIYKKAQPPHNDVKRADGLLLDLPEFLWHFAEKLSFKGSEPCKRFSVMVCNHSRDIARAVWSYCTDGIADGSANPGWALYLRALPDRGGSAASGQLKLHYSGLLERFPAYRWLVGCARRILSLGTVGENVMQHIAIRFPFQYPSSNVDLLLSPTLDRADFVLDWNLQSFLREQGYAGDPVNIFDHVITLTGWLDNVQALTCVQYMRQTWPESSDCVISLLHKLLEGSEICSSSGSLRDGTDLTGTFDGSKVVVHARGLPHALIEIGQQLAWLGAALQSAPDNRIAYCRPVLAHASPTLMTDWRYELKFTFQHGQSGQPLRKGRCWHGLFSNPVVVYGFPIRRRQLQNTGLDIPLNILGRLVPSRRIAHFGGKVCIKGHCTILVPTKVVDDTVIWHLICNDDGCYMDYTDSRVDAIPGLYPAGIDTNLIGFRHIVGWCPEAQVLTASPEADYGIDWSGLENADNGCDLQDAIISRGTMIPNYETPVIGKKDRPPHFEFGEYLHRILSIAKKYAVFYDVSTRRAWLVDGASALLHLVRASLMLSSSEDEMQEFVFRPELLEQHPSTEGGRTSAISVLKSEKNLVQRLYRNMPETFQDRVDAIYHLLEQAYAYQTRAKLQKSARLAPSHQARSFLEGFDFMDLAADEDHFKARTMSAFNSPPRWHRLTGAINAITLFGRGFGNLLKPKEMVPVCSSWTTVPSGKDYLAARVEDIMTIMRKKGNSLGSPWRVVNDVYWHMPDKLFENCQRDQDCSRKTCTHAQALLTSPEIAKHPSGIVNPIRLAPEGAIIFDGTPVNGLPQTLEVSFPSTLSGFKSPANDSAISVGYSPGSGTQESSSSNAEGKRPVNDWIPAPNSRKRVRRDSSNSSGGDIHHTEGASDFRGCNESFVTSGSSSQGSLAHNLQESQVENNFNRITRMETTGNIELDPAEYKVGWICALQIELDAAQRMLDRIHTKGFGHGTDCNLYILGQIGQLNIVLTCLPMGQYGNNIAAVVATRMMNRFPQIDIGLMVGIGGGLPSAKNDIRLGDVVVSKPHHQYGGVVQYDMGKLTSDGFITTGSLKAPPEKLLQVLNLMPRHGSAIAEPPDIAYPGIELDQLFKSSYGHTGNDDTCISCDPQQVVPRPMTRTTTSPRVFYGTIASGNSVVKNSEIREMLVQRHGVLCCEMEAAGLMNTKFPCLVIRGISDYADSHKNEIWMEYAAAAAAQYARDLLQALPADIPLSCGQGAVAIHVPCIHDVIHSQRME